MNSSDAEENIPKKKMVSRKYTMKDLHRLMDQGDIYSSFGKIQVSNKQTEPTATFGKASRDVQSKVYTCKADLKGLIGKA